MQWRISLYYIQDVILSQIPNNINKFKSKDWIGLTANYSLLIIAVILSGIGSAIFHPEAARMVNYAGGERKATAMSFFRVGGVLGLSIGPFAITTAVLAMGLKGAMITMVPVLLVSGLFLLQSSQLITLQKISKGGQHEKL